MKYKNCEITLTTKTTNRNNKIKYLYEITGRINKSYGLRPFIISIREAKEYINNK